MTVSELHKELELLIADGQGERDIVVDTHQTWYAKIERVTNLPRNRSIVIDISIKAGTR